MDHGMFRVTEGIFLPLPWDNPLLELSGWAGEMLAEMQLDESADITSWESRRCP